MMQAPRNRIRPARWLSQVALIVVLGACGEAHVVHREPDQVGPPRGLPAPRHAGTGEIEVIRGDTLYGIAFRNGMDFRELATINGIEAPYTIYVGQVLKLRGERAHPATPIKPLVQSPPRSAHGVPLPAPASATRPLPVVHQPVANAPEPANTTQHGAPTPFEPVQAAPVQAVPTVSPPVVQTPAHATLAQPVSQPPTVPPAPLFHAEPAPIARMPSAAIIPADVATVGGVHWRWPAKGTLLDRFMAGDATRQGIDISGTAGDPVLAASDGVVVYSGSGLVGYGELIIIKHSDEWLSAYGHNRKRLVQEGQRVKAGQPIAEMGNSGAPRDELHFEIRRNGRPVDPQQYLPAH